MNDMQGYAGVLLSNNHGVIGRRDWQSASTPDDLARLWDAVQRFRCFKARCSTRHAPRCSGMGDEVMTWVWQEAGKIVCRVEDGGKVLWHAVSSEWMKGSTRHSFHCCKADGKQKKDTKGRHKRMQSTVNHKKEMQPDAAGMHASATSCNTSPALAAGHA